MADLKYPLVTVSHLLLWERVSALAGESIFTYATPKVIYNSYAFGGHKWIFRRYPGKQGSEELILITSLNMTEVMGMLLKDCYGDQI